jgi:sorbitol/mannitol transport system substrate-binding protein
MGAKIMRLRHTGLITSLWLGLLFALPGHAQTVLTLTSGERAPWVGANLPQGGYVAELVSEAFKHSGYEVKLQFSSWARAKLQASQGDAVAMVCTETDTTPNSEFVYSTPFYGGVTGLLKKRSLKLPALNAGADPFKALAAYRVGAVREGVSLPAFEQASHSHHLKRELFTNDLQNLDMLLQDRIQLALIDKYSAAELMLSQRPHWIGKLELMKAPLVPSNFYLGFSKREKNHRQLQEAFNLGLAQLQRDGSLEKIMHKHGLFLPKKTSPGKVQLTIGTVNNSDMLVMQRLSREFEKQHPKIKLDWRIMDENTLRRRLLSDLALDDGQFDVMTIGTYELPIWAKQGWLGALNNLPKNYATDDLLPTVRKHLSHQGQLYALPFYAESAMTYYRKDLFAKAGVVMPAQPTYQEIAALAAKNHDPAVGVYGICLRGKPGWGENMALISMMVHAQGGRWFDLQWQPELVTAEWQGAVTRYVELLTKYGPPDAHKNGFNENLALFSEGRCAIWIDATVAAGMLFDPRRSKVSAQLGYAPAPRFEADKNSVWLWSWALAIPASSTHKPEAEQFIAWATSQSYIQSVAHSEGWVAVPPGTRKSTYTQPQYLKAAPFSRFVLKAIESADASDDRSKPYSPVQYVSIPEFQSIADQTGLEIAKVLQHEQSVDKALKRAQNFALDQMRNAERIK